ncbi:hypothetical protein CHS0354_017468 [Potamilus streckersoni]|uniref:Uncharacterized protein n=1 Tax=Potamilus streckersoni TaxID=2493646 RepID=A0AAE0WEW9_9BIVA|nr:hypothetical protein CHS0354_017468 [Potamilus streckersoni]
MKYVSSSKNEENGSGGSISFASYYNDHMVLQRGPKSNIIWGYATTVGSMVSVTLSGKPPVTTHVVEGPMAGKATWKVQLSPVSDPGPYEISVESDDGNTKIVDVLFGDVWLCSGQSNMQFTLPQFGPDKQCPRMLRFGPDKQRPLMFKFGPDKQRPLMFTFGPDKQCPLMFKFGPDKHAHLSSSLDQINNAQLCSHLDQINMLTVENTIPKIKCGTDTEHSVTLEFCQET